MQSVSFICIPLLCFSWNCVYILHVLYVQVAILNLPHPYLRTTIVLFDKVQPRLSKLSIIGTFCLVPACSVKRGCTILPCSDVSFYTI